MSLTLTQSWAVTYEGQSMAIPNKLVQTFDGEPYFRLCSTHLGTIKLLTQRTDVGKNASLAESPGIIAVRRARNIASGVLVSSAGSSKVMEGAVQQDDGAPQYKRARVVVQPRDAKVVCQVEGFGDITLRRAVNLDEAIFVPMNQADMLAMFQAIRQLGLCLKNESLGNTRTYVRSGKFAKRRGADGGEDHDDSDGGS